MSHSRETACGDAPSLLEQQLDQHTTAGALSRTEGKKVRCLACGHRCLLASGRRGVCRVRFNRNGVLKVPFGYVAGVGCDPVEKKPFFHVLPGSTTLTFGMLGCCFHCAFCQNWVTSQALRDPAAVAPFQPVTPEQLVGSAQQAGAALIVSSYNEPLITAEWAAAVFAKAQSAGLLCAFVSNGSATPEVLDHLTPWLAACKVDLKTFRQQRYRSMGGTLDRVTATIRDLHIRGVWVEVVTLLIPGYNDEPRELRELTAFLASVSPDIPWHVTAFHPDYQMTQTGRTSPESLLRAAEIGVASGLRFVYAGNLPGHVGRWEDTCCPECRSTLVERSGFVVRQCRVTSAGVCPVCSRQIPGIWGRCTGAAGLWGRGA